MNKKNKLSTIIAKIR